jgi:hypothetical protein
MWMDVHADAPRPKRGDLLHTNVGDHRRERTWLILRARHMRRAKHPRRYQLFAARWWEIEPDLRQRLFLSASRNGGQVLWHLQRYAPKKRRTFEDYLQR